MSADDLEWSEQIGQAAWIAPRLSAFDSGLAGSVIPRGFPAYARLLHPVAAGPMGERTVRWSEVAQWSGQSLNRLAHFHDLAMPERLPAGVPPWDSQGPTTGTLTAADAAVMVEVLAERTPVVNGVGRCWFCLWAGQGWDNAAYLLAADAPPEVRADAPRPPDPIPVRVRHGSRVGLPHRDYFLFTGPVRAAMAFVPGKQQTPNLWWSHDRSWCVASEIDLPWSYVGGSDELIAQVLAHPDLEALPAAPDDPRTFTVPGWLQTRLRTAVEDLLTHGETTVVTSVGTVLASLRVPTGVREGRLRIDSGRELPGGARGGGSEVPLRTGHMDRLQETVYSSLLHSVLSMVNN